MATNQGAFGRAATRPGIVLAWKAGTPFCAAFPFPTSGPIDIGRDPSRTISLGGDTEASTLHASISLKQDEQLRAPIVSVTDLNSRNGTFVNGIQLPKGSTTRFALAGRVRNTPFPNTPNAPFTPAPLPIIRTVSIGNSVLIVEPDIDRIDGRESLFEGDTVVGHKMQWIWMRAQAAARRGRTLLVQGESGTGKAGVAAVFNARSGRASGPFITFSCAMLAPMVAHSQLFGHTRDAFPGATSDQPGLFAAADGGVIFLDEIAELPLDVQAKLLHLIDTMEFSPLGSTKEQKVDVLICCSTSRDLFSMAKAGTFNADLLARLDQFQVRLPALRERPEEIPFFVELFRRRIPGAPPASVQFIEACILQDWPRNVRALEGAVERAAKEALDLVNVTDTLGGPRGKPQLQPGPDLAPWRDAVASQPGAYSIAPTAQPRPESVPPPDAPPMAVRAPTEIPAPLPVAHVAREAKVLIFIAALRENGGNVTEAADAAGLSHARAQDIVKQEPDLLAKT